MARSWSEDARSALDSYPWSDDREKARACEEAELVAFGAQVEVDDLPLPVRRWLRGPAQGPLSGWIWRGESWKELTEGFERTILEQALLRNGGFAAKAARALKTTPRVVSYKARKYGLPVRTSGKSKDINQSQDIKGN